MTEHDKELINRYIYEVTKRVQKEQRQEIEMELQELMEDMLQTMKLDLVFVKLGDPAIFARKYREDKNYVISPEYYDNYVWVMKIVLICVLAGLFISAVVSCVVNYDNIPYEIARFITEAMAGLLSAFGSVTLVFALLERQQVKVNIKNGKVWSPDMLDPIPDKKSTISRGDGIVSLVFIVLFSGLLIFAPQLFGAYGMNGNEVVTVPCFNLEKWGLILPFFLISLAVCFVDEMIKLLTGCYCRLVMVSSIITNAIQIIMAAIILKVLPIWNLDFGSEIMRWSSDFKMKVFWGNELIMGWNATFLSNVVLAVIVFASLLETGIVVYRTQRYGRK